MTQTGNRTMPELLAPAGSLEAFRAALAAGADAIYCGLGNDFNARRGAANFDDAAFAAACDEAHIAGVHVYVTINIVIQSSEMAAALALVYRAYTLGADAFIIQDWGLLAEVRRRWPQIECHISTQANVHDARATLWCNQLGAHRVTLSRELSLPEIKTISDTGVETEVFGHGALCYCYSGVCMMSSMSGGRSANRGMCAQPCRLLYDLIDEKGNVLEAQGRTRPLCPKDAFSLYDLDALAEAGAGSLKVEGRMKAPDYVYSVISAYRAQMDDVAAGRTVPQADAQQRMRLLLRSFNRNFTNAYLHGTAGDEMMSYERSNNRGQLVGSVISSCKLSDVVKTSRGTNGGRERKRITTRAQIVVQLDEPVGKGDLLEFRPHHNPSQFLTAHVVADAVAGEKIKCIASRPMPAGCPVRVIRSQAALDCASRIASMDIVRKRLVNVQVICRIGKPFTITMTTLDGVATACVEGFVVEAARTRAVSADEVREHVGRMGTTPFAVQDLTVCMDEGCGMGFSAVHKVRAQTAELLIQSILEPWHARKKKLVAAPTTEQLELGYVTRTAKSTASTVHNPQLCVLATTPEVARAARAFGEVRVYVSGDEHMAADFPQQCIPVLDEICREIDHARIDSFIHAGTTVAVGNVSELVHAQQQGAVAEIRSCIPVHNRACVQTLEAAGAQGFWLSPELTLTQIAQVASAATTPMGFVVYGRPRVMTAQHCVLMAANTCIHDCARCALRRRKLAIRNNQGAVMPVHTDLQARSRIYAAQPIDAIPQVAELLAAGVSRLAIDATLLSAEECVHELKRLVQAIKAAQGKGKAPLREQGASSGHLFIGIE
ncbi:MAG: U32 family peptidase [Atopobium sp.]|uniref:U32 family peptidase n=1 Tax=Atopobium sp. TaxID=1872650 RepID=UPI002A819589|nr:U32 family peptidase [Atopobium sp.]MDY4523204.1 U32 family peptidase [Atopobium sp.]